MRCTCQCVLTVIPIILVVKKKSRHAPKVDPQLMEQFIWMVDSVTSPDLQSAIVSYTQCRNREWDQWELKITQREQNFYDREYFANKIDGAY